MTDAPDEFAAFYPLEHDQGTAAWRDDRCGFITASKFSVISDKPTKGADSYMLELIGEELTGFPVRSVVGVSSMDHGNEHEADARQAYEAAKFSSVKQVGFQKHPTEKKVGCSPDGIIGDDGTIEIKCPQTPREHVRALLYGMPKEHAPQVQGGLWVTGRAWCDFVSYHPAFKSAGCELVIVRQPRDEEYIAKLAERIGKFRDRLDIALKEIAEKTGAPF